VVLSEDDGGTAGGLAGGAAFGNGDDPTGTLLEFIQSPEPGGPGFPEGFGISHPLRPVLEAIVSLKRKALALEEENRRMGEALESSRERVRELDQRVRTLGEDLLDVREWERRNVAEDLHDTVCQTLGYGIGKLKGFLAGHGEERRTLGEILKLLEMTMRQVRAITYAICPPILKDFDLDVALGWLTEDMMQSHSIAICYTNGIRGELAMDEKVKEILFRAVRELLVNVIKHSGSTSAQLSLRIENGTLRILVEDCGRGFDPGDTVSRKAAGFGLFSVTERLRPIGGEVGIESRVNEGTRVILSLPLDALRTS
jgi:signal transduction histidine kinase